MNDRELYRRVRNLVADELLLFAEGSATANVWRAPGMVASIVPAAPDRSLFNGMQCASIAVLRDHYDAIASTYDAAGIRAWTVWTDPGDTKAAEFLAARGHVLDAQPTAMAAVIESLHLPAADGLAWGETNEPADIARINDAAYGFPPPAFAAALERTLAPGWHGYVALMNGRPVAGVLTNLSAEGDCGITGLAALPETRGQRIGTRLLACALRDAQLKGASTASLQATSKGVPVYAAMGFRDLGRMGMWEKRKPVADATPGLNT